MHRKITKDAFKWQEVFVGMDVHKKDFKVTDNRSLLRVRESIVKEIRRCKQRIKSFLSFYGIKLPAEYAEARKHWSRAFIQWIESIPFAHETASQALRVHINSLKYHRDQLLQLTRQIRSLSRTDHYRGAVEKLVTVSDSVC